MHESVGNEVSKQIVIQNKIQTSRKTSSIQVLVQVVGRFGQQTSCNDSEESREKQEDGNDEFEEAHFSQTLIFLSVFSSFLSQFKCLKRGQNFGKKSPRKIKQRNKEEQSMKMVHNLKFNLDEATRNQ